MLIIFKLAYFLRAYRPFYLLILLNMGYMRETMIISSSKLSFIYREFANNSYNSYSENYYIVFHLAVANNFVSLEGIVDSYPTNLEQKLCETSAN